MFLRFFGDRNRHVPGAVHRHADGGLFGLYAKHRPSAHDLHGPHHGVRRGIEIKRVIVTQHVGQRIGICQPERERFGIPERLGFNLDQLFTEHKREQFGKLITVSFGQLFPERFGFGLDQLLALHLGQFQPEHEREQFGQFVTVNLDQCFTECEREQFNFSFTERISIRVTELKL